MKISDGKLAITRKNNDSSSDSKRTILALANSRDNESLIRAASYNSNLIMDKMRNHFPAEWVKAWTCRKNGS